MAMTYTNAAGNLVSNSVDPIRTSYTPTFHHTWRAIEETIPLGVQLTLTITREGCAPTILLYTKKEAGWVDFFGYAHNAAEPLDLASTLDAAGYSIAVKID